MNRYDAGNEAASAHDPIRGSAGDDSQRAYHESVLPKFSLEKRLEVLAYQVVILVTIAGVRQRDLARAVGVSASQFSRYLSGRSAATASVRKKLAYFLYIPSSVLLQTTPMMTAMRYIMTVWLPHHLVTARKRLRDAGCVISVRGQQCEPNPDDHNT